MSSRRDIILGALGLAVATSGRIGTAVAQTSSPTAPSSNTLASSAPPYKAGTAERALDMINLYDVEAEAEKLIPKAQFGYIAGGSGDEWTLKENTRAFDDRQILPRYLRGFDAPDTATELLGAKVGLPVFVPPMAAHGLAHATAERGSAKGGRAGRRQSRLRPLRQHCGASRRQPRGERAADADRHH